MKKKLITIIAIFLLIILVFLSFYFNKSVIDFLINIDVSNINFLVFYIIVCFSYFLTPLPVTLIVILNGYLFKKIGFFISLSLILLASAILYLFAKKIKNSFDLDFEKIFLKKKINLSKLTTNNFSIFLSRFILPYFLHNIYYGLVDVKIKKFILIIFCAEIPILYALNSIGNSVKNLTSNYKISFLDIVSDINFYLPFFIIFAIFIVVNYLQTKFKKN